MTKTHFAALIVVELLLHSAQIPRSPTEKRQEVSSASPLRVSVVEMSTSKPIVGASVNVYRRGETQVIAHGTTDASGDSTVILPMGLLDVRVDHPHYCSIKTSIKTPRSRRLSSRLDPCHRASGTVRNKRGQPVEGAAVVFVSPEGICMVDGRSDSTGRFEDKSLLAKTYRVVIAAPSHPLTWHPEPLTISSHRVEGIELVVDDYEEAVLFSGRVLDESGQPIPSARLTWDSDRMESGQYRLIADSLNPEERRRFKILTKARRTLEYRVDSQGRFEMLLRPRKHDRVKVEAPGFRVLSSDIDLNGDVREEFQLERYPSTRIRVIDGHGRLVEHLRITGASPRNGDHLLHPLGPEGSFYFEGFPLYVSAYNLEDDLGVSEQILIKEPTPEIVLHLDQPGSLEGHVDMGGYENQLGFTVVFYHRIKGPHGTYIAKSFGSESGGAFRLDGLPLGPCYIQITASHHEFEGFGGQVDIKPETYLRVSLPRRGGGNR